MPVLSLTSTSKSMSGFIQSSSCSAVGFVNVISGSVSSKSIVKLFSSDVAVSSPDVDSTI